MTFEVYLRPSLVLLSGSLPGSSAMPGTLTVTDDGLELRVVRGST
jgi:hypothetical protein